MNIFYNPASYNSPTDYSTKVVSAGPTAFVSSYMLVNSATDLQNVSQNLSGSFALGRNIDASATATWNNGAGFIPIGNAETPFVGTLNGDGRTIDRLTINSSSPYVGLFGVIGAQRACEVACIIGSVRDLNLTNVDITANSGSVGAIAGRLDGGPFAPGGIVSGVTATGSVTGNGSGHVGGLVGESYGFVQGAHTNVVVRGGADALSVGGLVGLNSGSIDESYAIGSVTSFSVNPAGGLVGINTCCTIINEGPGPFAGGINQSYASGAVSGPGITGGLVGQSTGAGSVVSSYWDIETTKQQNSAGGVGLSTTSRPAAVQLPRLPFDDDDQGGWFMIDGQTRPFLVGEQSFSGGPRFALSIGNAHQLQLMQHFHNIVPNAPYELTANINLGAALANPSDIWAGRPQGFITIGSADRPYTGRFEGNGYTIDGLRIAPTDGRNSIGLFAAIGPGGLVQNFTLSNVSITADPNAYYYGQQFVGALAGRNAGTIANVHVTGTVSGVPTDDGEPINLTGVIAGGLVGQNGIFGEPNMSGTITNSSAAVDVTLGNGCAGDCYGGTNFAGGLVGFNIAGSTISSSNASGSVTGGAYSFVGGLVGQNDGSVTNSFASATVASTSTGAFFSSAVGGLVGFNTGLISGAHASGNASGVGSPESFLSAIVGGLAGLNNEGGQIVDSYATGAVSGTNSVQLGGLVGGNFAAITNSYATGAVTGNGRGSVGGLVGNNFSGGTITGSHATGAVGGTGSLNAGGLVGDNSATVSNSYATGNVAVANTGATDVVVGGFVASNDGNISGSYATGNVTTTNGDVTGGGFAGFSLGSIINSYATGNVTANGASLAMLGGFTGGNLGTITNSHATGNVTTNAAFAIAGGFVGFKSARSTCLSRPATSPSATTASSAALSASISARSTRLMPTAPSTGGANSFVGGFVGANLGVDVSGEFGDSAQASASSVPGLITQSYALGSGDRRQRRDRRSFAALNLG